jgi:hypothetical protein
MIGSITLMLAEYNALAEEKRDHQRPSPHRHVDDGAAGAGRHRQEIRGKGTPEERDRVLGSLASLERGEAWLWSPSWLARRPASG